MIGKEKSAWGTEKEHCISYLLLQNKLPQHLVAWNNKLLLAYIYSRTQESGNALAE